VGFAGLISTHRHFAPASNYRITETNLAKDPSSGQAAGSRQSKARRKGVTIDLEAEDVKGSSKKSPVAGAARKPAQSASSEAGSSKPEPSKAAGGRPAKELRGGGTAEADKTETAKPAVSSAASRYVAAFVGGIIALGGAVALDRLQILSIFGGEAGLSDLQTQITGVKEDSGGQIADLQTQIAALSAASGTDADGLAALGEKIARIEALLAGQDERIANAGQREALADLEARLSALESAVQSGAAGPDVGLAAIEKRIAGVEAAIAGVQGRTGDTASIALATVKPEIDRLTAITDEISGRVDTLKGGLSELVDPKIVAALGARVEQLAGVIGKSASPQTIAALKSALAAESLAAAVTAGRPFAAELRILQSGPDGGADLGVLAPYAEKGLPDAAALAAEFEALIPSLSSPEPERPAAPESTGLVGRLLASARNAVEVRRAGPAVGGELIGQTGAIVQALNGNAFKTALTAWQDLPAEARQASAGWAAKLEARLAADALAGTLRTEALTRLIAAGAGDGQ
jgi:hypothetical protein